LLGLVKLLFYKLKNIEYEIIRVRKSNSD
jgi:hypothetical protein